MKNKIVLFLSIAAMLVPLFTPSAPAFAQSASESEVQELKRMIEEMKKGGPEEDPMKDFGHQKIS